MANGVGAAARFDEPVGVAWLDAVHYRSFLQSASQPPPSAAGEEPTSAGGGSGGVFGGDDGGGGAGGDLNGSAAAAAAAGGGRLLVTDQGNHRICAIDPATGAVTPFAGTGEEGGDDGPVAAATFCAPYGIAVARDGTVFVSEEGDHRIRAIHPPAPPANSDTGGDRDNNDSDGDRDGGWVVTTLAGSDDEGFADGLGEAAQFSSPRGIAVGARDGMLYVVSLPRAAKRAADEYDMR